MKIDILINCDISYSSYFILGFQQLARAGKINFNIATSPRAREFSDIVCQLGEDALSGSIIIKLENDNKMVLASTDVADRSDPGAARSYNRGLLSLVDVYFKTNINRALESQDPELSQFTHKILDLPYPFSIRPEQSVKLLAAHSQGENIIERVQGIIDNGYTAYRIMKPLSYFEQIRKLPKIRDFNFLVTYYPHPDHKEDNEFRLELVRKLREDNSLNGVAAFASSESVPAPYSEYTTSFISLDKLLRDYAQSRVAVYVRGLHDCLSFKLGQYLALGMPIAGQEIVLDNDFAQAIPNYKEQFNCKTPDEIVTSIKSLINGPLGRMEELGRSNSEFFYDNVSPIKTAEYIVSKMKSCIK